jgi:putative Mn2+ efflux pump MntP
MTKCARKSAQKLSVDHVLSSALLAISSNVDNLSAGLAYGVGRRRIRWRHNLLIAAVSGGVTLVTMSVGEWVNDFMSEALANVLGSAVMIAVGLYGIARTARRRVPTRF